jgi:hypothetical protein
MPRRRTDPCRHSRICIKQKKAGQGNTAYRCATIRASLINDPICLKAFVIFYWLSIADNIWTWSQLP